MRYAWLLLLIGCHTPQIPRSVTYPDYVLTNVGPHLMLVQEEIRIAVRVKREARVGEEVVAEVTVLGDPAKRYRLEIGSSRWLVLKSPAHVTVRGRQPVAIRFTRIREGKAEIPVSAWQL